MPGNGPSAPAAIVGADEVAADPDPDGVGDAEPGDAELGDAEGADAEPDDAETVDPEADDVVATAPDPALGVHAPASRASGSASAAIAAGRIRRRTINAALLRLVLTCGTCSVGGEPKRSGRHQR
jgi:hypothetical protein